MAERPDRHPWLDLLEVDGPFLSRPALDDVYDDAWPPKIANEHRDTLDLPAVLPTEWDETTMDQVDRVLTEVLGYREGRTLKSNPGTVIHPIYDNAAVSPHAAAYSRREPDKCRLVVLAGPAAAETPGSLDPETITSHYGWPSTAVQRAALAARGFGAELALVTNGWQHLVVWVGSGITGWAWVDASLYRLDRRLADAFVALLSASSVSTDADTSTADLLRLSQDKQVDVTEKLGTQIRMAAEALVNAVSRANRNTDGKLLAGVAPDEVYSGVVTVLMRTVFLLNAEERDLISSGDLWDRSYSVSGLLDQLDDDHYRHQGVMRRRHGAWLRLLAAARAVHGGVNHLQMNVPAYGGNLFDPVRHPFLEGVGVDGEAFDVGVVDDATTRHVLELLQRLGGQRLSYRAFSVEQIGQVYESLLDHSAVSVPEDTVVLGLVGAKGAEPELELADLEAQQANGKLAYWLAKNHDPANGQGKVEKWQGRVDRTPDERVAATLSKACQGDADSLARVEKFAGLLRTDARGVALVFLPGDVYVTETANRRDTGTAYTSPEFAAEIAHHALEHLVYEPGPHNEEEESNWQIKRPEEILELRICDPAVGSGAILVAAVRYLAHRLVRSRLHYGELTERDLETAAADPMATGPYVQARRDVVSQCIYAVDRDPMAVEMAKLSLWLITMARGRPFTFLDHLIKCGDSLLGVTSLDQLRRLHLDASASTQIGLDLDGGRVEGLGGYFSMIEERISQALALRKLVGDGDVEDSVDARHRAQLNATAENALADLRLVADAITAVCYLTADANREAVATALRERLLPLATRLEESREGLEELASERPLDAPGFFHFFHWAVEFPEIAHAGGFDAIVGNPPFQGGKKISTTSGSSYRSHLVRYCAGGQTGSADLVSYFFRRSAAMAGSFGLIATNSIAQGDTRRVALSPIVGDAGYVARANSSAPWPGRDSVHVAQVWWRAGVACLPGAVLDGLEVSGIEADLYPRGRVGGFPLQLPNRNGWSHVGHFLRGKGFVVDRQTADGWIKEDPSNQAVVVPYINGEWVYASPNEQEATARWIVCFEQMTEQKAAAFELPFEHVAEEVRPERMKVKEKSHRERWWQFAAYKANLEAAIDDAGGASVLTRHSKWLIPAVVAPGNIVSDACVVFPFSWDLHGLLSSTVHRVWADRYCSTIGVGLRYTPSDGFDTMPMAVSASHKSSVAQLAESLVSLRGSLCDDGDVGISDLYALFHRQSEQGGEVNQLRDLHIALDYEVCRAYGWPELDLGHGFHDTRYGHFFTVSTEARFELLMRLLQLNFEQAAEQTGRSYESILREAHQHV